MSSSAHALRAASGEAAWRSARDSLAGALRGEAVRVLACEGVPAQARDDLAQAVAVAVLERIVGGAVTAGSEDGYVATAAKNRARDWHRERSGVYEKEGMVDEDALAAPDGDPLSVLESAEDDARRRLLEVRVVRLLASAPARYRDALVAVYLEGVPIDALVEIEMRAEWREPSQASLDEARAAPPEEAAFLARRRARARVDKLLQRARDWIRARLADSEEIAG